MICGYLQMMLRLAGGLELESCNSMCVCTRGFRGGELLLALCNYDYDFELLLALHIREGPSPRVFVAPQVDPTTVEMLKAMNVPSVLAGVTVQSANARPPFQRKDFNKN